MAVEQHDPAEADGGQAGDDVLDEGHERRDPDVDEPGEPDVRVRQAVVDRRGDDRADVRGHAPCDLGRDERIGEQRTVRAVLLGRADRHDHGVVVGEEPLHLGARHLAEEHGRRLASGLLLRVDVRRWSVVSSPMPSIQQVTTSPGSRCRSGPGGVASLAGVPLTMRSPGRSVDVAAEEREDARRSGSACPTCGRPGSVRR